MSHPLYVKIQGIERKYEPTQVKGVPDEHWAEEDKAEYKKLTTEMSTVWVDCWKNLFDALKKVDKDLHQKEKKEAELFN